MNEMIEQLKQQFTAFGPNLLAALAVLVLGSLVALLVAFVVRRHHDSDPAASAEAAL